MQTTITEALAEIQTLIKRLDAKRKFVADYAYRPAALRDPFENDGGSKAQVEAAMQSIHDLSERIVALRRAIAEANASTYITVAGISRPIADWLVFRREVAPMERQFIRELRQSINHAREQATRRGGQMTESATDGKNDIVVNLSEKHLNERAERIEQVLGELDGLLSLKNATTVIEVED